MIEEVFSTYLFNSDVESEIANTNIRKAELLGNTLKNASEVDAFYKSTGIKFIIEAIIFKRKFETKIKNIFIETSTIASTIQQKELTSFLGVLDNSGDLFKITVENNFLKIIDTLNQQNKLLLWHPEFFLKPKKALGYISILDSDNWSECKLNNTDSHSTYKFQKLDLNRDPKTTGNTITNNCNIWLKKEVIKDRDYDVLSHNSISEKYKGVDVEDLQKITHKFYHKFLLLEGKNRSVLISIPFVSSSGNYYPNGPDIYFEGYGALFIFIEMENFDDLEALKRTSTDVVEEIALNIGKFATNYLFSTATSLLKETKKQAIKAAVSQVNARTTSHNTGSHILANDIEAETSEDLREFKYYLRQRMLYNADLASDSTKAYSPILLSDILKSFEKLVVIKKYISGIKDKVFKEFKEKSKIKNCIVSIPNDILGYQGIYIIFENLIRNYFKHGRGTGDLFKKDELSLKIYEVPISNLYYRCFELTDGSIIDSDKYQRIAALIDGPILKNDMLRKEGLGYLEIKAALCYLNDLALDNIDNTFIDQNQSLKLFSIQEISDTDKTLRYRFYLKKPFFLKISNSDKLNENLLQKGVVDSQTDTELDTHCGFYCSEANAINDARITQRIIKEKIIFTDSDNLNDKTLNLYGKWLSLMNAPKSAICVLEKNALSTGNSSTIEYKQLVKTKAGQDQNYETNAIEEKEVFSSYPILFDSHCNRIEHILKLSEKGNVKLFYEDFKTDGNTGKIIQNYHEQKKSYLLEQIIEAAHTHVIILDERIQRYADKRYAEVNSDFIGMIDGEKRLLKGEELEVNGENYNELSELTTRKVLEMMNIYVPDNSELSMNNEKFENAFMLKANHYITENLRPTGLNIVIIHLGVIEKLTANKTPDVISTIINEIVGNKFNKSNVIITSERGTPDNLENYYRFLHFSNISKHIIEDKSKLGLVAALFNSRSLNKVQLS